MGMSMETLAQGGLGFTAAKKPGFSFEKVYGKKKEDKNKAGKKKKYAYNPREISGELLRASKASSAAVVMVKAKEKVAVLEQALSSGAYEEADVRRALVHAKKMVECSKMKVLHLKEEEQMAVKHQRERQGRDIKKKAGIQRKLARKEQELRQKIALEESHDVLWEKTRRQELMQKKKNNRREELEKITDAELKYLESQMREEGGDSFSDFSGVSVELSGGTMEMGEIAMSGDASGFAVPVGTAVDVCV